MQTFVPTKPPYKSYRIQSVGRKFQTLFLSDGLLMGYRISKSMKAATQKGQDFVDGKLKTARFVCFRR